MQLCTPFITDRDASAPYKVTSYNLLWRQPLMWEIIWTSLLPRLLLSKKLHRFWKTAQWPCVSKKWP